MLSQDGGEPDLVQRGVHPRCVPLRRGPEFARFVQLAPDRQATGLKKRRYERLQRSRARVVDPAFPVLDRSHTRANAVGQLALSQASSAAVAQQ